jgi:hypothetical protein
MTRSIAIVSAMILALTPTSATRAQLASGYSGQSSARGKALRMSSGGAFAVWAIALQTQRRSWPSPCWRPLPIPKSESVASRALLGKNTSCLTGFVSMRLPTYLVRGAVAEYLYKRTTVAPPPADASVAPASIDRSKLDQLNPYALLAGFARCYVAARPSDVHGLLGTTKAGSKQEAAALGAMKSNFAVCLPTGVSIEFQPGETRGALAEALYHRSNRGSATRPVS